MSIWKRCSSMKKLNLLSYIYLIPVSTFAASNSPWQVSDSSNHDFTSRYSATQQESNEHYSFGNRSKPVTAAPGITSSSSYVSTNAMQAVKGGKFVLMDTMLQSTEASPSVLFVQGGNNSRSHNSTMRPEMGAWLANQLATNTLFLLQLHDREGARYLSNNDNGAGMWMIQTGEHNRFNDNSGQLKTKSNRFMVQIGADLGQWNFTTEDRVYFGIMAGYAHSNSQTHSDVSGYSSKGRTKGYSLGGYGTWYQNIANREGAYIDNSLRYNWFHNSVSGQDIDSEIYTSRGVQASLESGYSTKLTNNGVLSSWVQPKAQIVWTNITANDYIEPNGTRTHQQTSSNIMTRLGVRVFLRGHSTFDSNNGREFQPFVETSWIHNTQDWRIKMDDTANSIEGTRNIGEAKLGVEGHVAPTIDMWGNVTQQVGDSGYTSTQAMLGLKYRF